MSTVLKSERKVGQRLSCQGYLGEVSSQPELSSPRLIIFPRHLLAVVEGLLVTEGTSWK